MGIPVNWRFFRLEEINHQRVIDARGLGVPTLFIEGQCLFGPVLADPPTGPPALKLSSVVTGMAELPYVYELRRPNSPADVDLIAQRLRPTSMGAIGSASIAVQLWMSSTSPADAVEVH